MILHSVFYTFRSEVPAPRRAQIIGELAEFSQTLDGVLGFESGANRDFENKSSAYAEGFVVRFRDDSALHAYAVHPTHQQLGAQLCDLCIDGADGIIVFDLDVPDIPR